MIKKSFEIAGRAMLNAAKSQLSRKELYLTVLGVGLGVGIASRSVSKSIEAGLYAGIGVIGCSGIHIIPRAVDQVLKNES